VPLLPSLVAVIVAVPTTSPVTSPVPVTLATLSALLAHVTVRPVKVLPLASLRIAVNCWVAPTTTLAVAGLTVTVATGAGAPAAVVPLATLESAPASPVIADGTVQGSTGPNVSGSFTLI